MSAYPSLISPLMNSDGLITTAALNTEAQTALASGVAANAKADTLLATALQTSGSNYVGLAQAGIALRDAGSRTSILITPNDGVISTNKTVLAKGAGTGINCFENLDKSFSVQANGNCTVNELTYTSLNPPIAPGPTPTLAEVLAAGNDGGTYGIVNISYVTAKDSLQILKDADQPELGIYAFTSGPTGFNVDEGASLTANTLIGGSPDGIALQNADASFRANYDGSVNATSFNLPNSTSIISGGNGVISFDGASLTEVTDITTTGNIYNTNAGGTLNVSTNNIKVYTDDKVSQVGAIDSAGNSYLQNYYLWGVSASDFAITNDKNILTTGEITCAQLNCSTFNPPIATPTLAQVLAVGADGNQVDITNCGNITASGFTTAGQVEANSILIKDNTQTVVGGIDSIGLISGSQLNIGGVAQIDTVGNITCELVNGVAPEFKPTYNYFVSKGGNDTEGLGSILSPYLTIQKAISVCEAFTDGVPRVVNVLAGSYVENLTLTKSRISIIGQGQSSRPDVGTSISGTITITIASGNSDLNNNNIYFSNFLINGQFEDNTSSTSYPHRVFFDRCQLYANNRVLYLHSAGDYRAFVSNCVISNDDTNATDPVVECYSSNSGMVSFTSNQITSKGISQNVFKLSGSCRTDTLAQNIFTSDSTGTNVAIAIFVHNSSAVITLGQNAFIYSSSGAKRNADTASGIYMNAASAGGSLIIANNLFSLTGLPNGQHAVQNNSSAGIVIYGGNISTASAAGQSAHDISGTNNSTKFAMTAVQ
jgi:hypothetical protein